jgi:hypothetical protein
MRSYKAKAYTPTEDEFELFRFITTPKEVAKHYHYTQRTVQQWCDEGKVAAHKIDSGWIISIASVKRFVEARERR